MLNELQEAEMRELFLDKRCACGYPYNPTDEQLRQLSQEGQLKIRCCFWGCGYTTTFSYFPPDMLKIESDQLREDIPKPCCITAQ
jgi:hypothetical protein